MVFWRKKKERFGLRGLIWLTLFIILVGGGVQAYRWVKNLTPADLIESPIVQDLVKGSLSTQGQKLFGLIPDLAGLEEPRTILFLFQNNSELRPTGGFIGVYAVARVDRGTFDLLKVEGTEILDAQTPADWRPTPPKPITEYLGVDRWYFRDSNWSPDFSITAQKALELYTKEGGIAAEEIDTVIAVTPTVIARFLEVTGPLEVHGITFTSDNFTEKLEYEVLFGFAKRGIAVQNRKAILKDLTEQLFDKLSTSVFEKSNEYVDILSRLITEKHIVMYSRDEALQQKFNDLNISGFVQPSTHDYILWIDANLAALKSDHAMERAMRYSITSTPEGRYMGTVEMTYDHTGIFDWRTTRYLSYTRIFVPLGAELASVGGSLAEKGQIADMVDSGRDLGKQWFGTHIRIEPGNTETLSFSYYLPELVVGDIERGLYELGIQKQPGTDAHGLTLDLDFGTTITAAKPAEEQIEWGDSVYRMESNLRVDRAFRVGLQPLE